MRIKYRRWSKWDNLAYFKSKDSRQLRDRWQIIREVSRKHLSKEAQLKLEWIIFYETIGKRDASLTACHFGISRKTFHKWYSRFNEQRLSSLEEHSRKPHKLRSWTVTTQEQTRIIALRKSHLRWGKLKLKSLYESRFGESISTWKIERIIREYRLFADLNQHQKQVQKTRKRAKPKLLIKQMAMEEIFPGHLWHTDAIITYWYGARKVIFTAIEHFTKLGFAKVYNTNSSQNATDFLKRLVALSGGDIKIIHSDNGSEFAGKFEEACQQLTIAQVYSRVRTPKDNAALERFNRTVQEEWLTLSEVGLDDIQATNQDLLNWLIEYNDVRPHQALDYQTPLAYAQQHYFPHVLPMWSASTVGCV